MSSPLISTQPNIKAGMCPHGVPQSSCPICNQQGGGMSRVNNKAATKPAHAGEWSYQKCYAVGLQIKAANQRRESKSSTSSPVSAVESTVENCSATNVARALKSCPTRRRFCDSVRQTDGCRSFQSIPTCAR